VLRESFSISDLGLRIADFFENDHRKSDIKLWHQMD
jgi:hypothetical protein